MAGVTQYLVFVNGIAGSRIEGSDMRNQNGGSAIARFLCEQLPNAQLVTFDLVEGLNGTRAWVNALDIGQRALKLLQRLNQKRLVGTTEDDGYHEKNDPSNIRIIFAGHDIGGFVIKQALLIAHVVEPSFQWVSLGTIAALFFDTPTLLSGITDWEKAIIYTLANSRTNVDFISLTQTLPAYAARLEYEFTSIPSSYHIVDFHSSMYDLALSSVAHSSTQISKHSDKAVSLKCGIGDSWAASGYEEVKDALSNIVSRLRDTVLDGSDGRKYSRLCSQVMAQLYPEINSSPASVDSSLPDYLSDRVLQMEPMHDWFETQDHGVILVVDPAGAGSNLVASKLNLSLRTNGEQVFSYEIGERDGDNASMRALFFSLCQQALQTLPVSKHASRLCSWVLEGGSVSKEALRGLLCSLLSSNSSSRIYCIIRELNRLTPASQTALLHDLEIIRSHAQRPFKLFLTSETIGNWDQMEPPYKVVHFDQEVLPELEIMRFTKTRLANLVRRVPVWDRVIKDLDMAEKLCIESDTIFEVAQKLDFLESCSFPETIQAVEKVVARLPARLQDLHQVIIDDVHRDSPIGLSAMYWITNSKRSLTLAELAVCGALEKCTKNGMDLGTLVKNISWNPEADLRRSLGPICQVVNNRVKVRHRIYFDLAETGNTSTIPKDVHLHLLIQCIDYQSLAFDHLRNGKIDTKTGKHEAKFCFIEYSVLHWPHHYLNSKDKEQAKSKTVSFLEDSETFRLWLEAYELYTRREYEDGKEDAKEDGKAPRSPLELACYFGLVEVMDHFLEQSAVPNLPPQSYQTAMEFAAERGHAEIVERLVNRTTVAPGVLHLAARGNHLECIKVLITAGANPNEFHCFEYNSLLEAARRGYVDGVDTMIENQADCNTVSKTLMLSALQLASRLGNADLVQRLLDSGASLTSTDNTGYDALKYAAEGGFHRVVEVLLNHSFTVMTNRTEDIVGTSSCERIDMDAKAKCGNTAIHLAAAGGHSAVVQLLLTKNAKLGLMNNDGHTPLHVACQAGFVGVVEQLISVVSNSQANEDNPSEKRPIPDEENSGPSEATALSPIELAVKCQHLQVVKLLLRPNLVVTRDSSFKALFLACQLGYVDIAEALFQLYQNRAYLKDDDSDQDGDGNTALHIAAKYGKVEIMDMILTQEYVPIDYLNKQRETALHLAAEAGHVNVCDTLLRQGASTTIVASDHTPIHYAAKAGHVPAVKILLQHSPTKADGPLLHLAVTQGSEEMTRAIIASSNSGTVPVLDWKNDDGDTAVHVAIHNLHAHLIPVLNEAGVDMGITNNNRETPFFLAVEAGELDAVEQLFATGADIKLDEPNNAGISPLMMMCMELDYQGVGSRIEMSKRVDPLRAILKSDKKVLVDRKHPKTGRTALHYSTDLGKPDELALSLLAAHADPNIQNSRGSTPLFLAAEVGRLNIVEALLNAGAKAAITNNSNSTPLHRAAQNDHAPCIEALVKAGADKDYESNHGYTPLGLAAARGMEEAVEALIRLGASLPLAIRDVIRGDDEIAAKSLWVKRDSETVGRLNQPHMRWGSMLGLAVAQGSNEMVNMLLEEHELDLNVVDAFERTPVMIATIHDTGSESLVGTLLDKGADPNTRDIEGKSPLVRALMADHFRNVEKLLNCGKIDITLPDSRGHTAMYWASRSAESPEGKAAFDKIMAKIEALEEGPKHTSIVEDAIHGSVASGNKWALEKLLAIPDININHADHDGWTALRMAQSYGHDELSKVLIEHGAELEPNGQKPPLPSKWHLVDKSPALSVQSPLSRVVEVKETLTNDISSGDEFEWAVIRADHCMPSDNDYYFEVKIEKGSEFGDLVGIGFCEDSAPLDQMLGINSAGSWGYHADDGCVYPSHMSLDEDYGFQVQYQEGDTVGCGTNISEKSAFFTLNGKKLGVAFRGLRGKLYPATFTSTQKKGVKLVAAFENTAEQPWMYGSTKAEGTEAEVNEAVSSENTSAGEEDD